MTGERLTRAQVAEHLGVSADTVSAYVSRGQMPGPDGRLGRTPWWRASTIRKWQAARPGMGAGGGRKRKPA